MYFSRRGFLAGAAVTLPGLGLGGWRRAFADDAPAMRGPYGPLGPPDANGLRLPPGFSARLIAMTGELVAGTSFVWHGQPDGGATFADPRSGGWVYVSNAELADGGGVGAIRFDRSGAVVDAYRILDGTSVNCAGGPTPWGTWLSCEEVPLGRVWECNPLAPGQGIARPGLGRFKHEAAAVDPATGFVYLTEDERDSRLYRFRPNRPGDLADGTLEAADVSRRGRVRWIAVSADRPDRQRKTTRFLRGEGAWFSAGVVYFTTTADHRVWALETARDRLEIIYDAEQRGPDAPLRWPDNITVHEHSGDIFVAEDGDDLQLVLLADGRGRRIAAPFLELVGHDGSELTGPSFSPDGSRLYLSSQRGRGDRRGMTFEITGPFRRD